MIIEGQLSRLYPPCPLYLRVSESNPSVELLERDFNETFEVWSFKDFMTLRTALKEPSFSPISFSRRTKKRYQAVLDLLRTYKDQLNAQF